MENVCKKVVSERRILGENEGVITGILSHEDLEKIKCSIQEGKVRRLNRLMRTIDGEREESLSVLLEFDGTILPNRTKIGKTFLLRFSATNARDMGTLHRFARESRGVQSVMVSISMRIVIRMCSLNIVIVVDSTV